MNRIISMTFVCYSSSRLLYSRNHEVDTSIDSCKYEEEKIYFHNYKHFYRQDQEEYLFNITDTIPVRNKLERKCCFVNNKCSDRKKCNRMRNRSKDCLKD